MSTSSAPTGEPVVSFRDLDFAFPGREPIWRGLNLDLAAGGFYLVRGPSGAGKSTLLRLLCRLEEPTAGKILFKGQNIAEISPPLLRRSMLYIQQTPTVIEGSVKDNLLLPYTFRINRDLDRPSDQDLKKLIEEFLLDGVGLDDGAGTLSVGQMQRLCFIRGLVLNPEVWLLDEPTSALDDESRRVVEAAVDRLADRTVILVSHQAGSGSGRPPTELLVKNNSLEVVK